MHKVSDIRNTSSKLKLILETYILEVCLHTAGAIAFTSWSLQNGRTSRYTRHAVLIARWEAVHLLKQPILSTKTSYDEAAGTVNCLFLPLTA